MVALTKYAAKWKLFIQVRVSRPIRTSFDFNESIYCSYIQNNHILVYTNIDIDSLRYVNCISQCQWCVLSTYILARYCQTSGIRRTNSWTLNVSRLVLSFLSNPLTPGVKPRMKMLLEQRRQAMLQLHLSDQQVYCLLRCGLYQKFDGLSS